MFDINNCSTSQPGVLSNSLERPSNNTKNSAHSLTVQVTTKDPNRPTNALTGMPGLIGMNSAIKSPRKSDEAERCRKTSLNPHSPDDTDLISSEVNIKRRISIRSSPKSSMIDKKSPSNQESLHNRSPVDEDKKVQEMLRLHEQLLKSTEDLNLNYTLPTGI